MGGDSKTLFYPSLFYNVTMAKISSRRWYDKVDDNIFLGAIPFKSDAEKLATKENVKGVVSLCEDHEMKHFVAKKEDWVRLGVEQLQLSTVDFSCPSTEDIEKGVAFIDKFVSQNEAVYVHCKAGRTRSATLVGCYLIYKNKWTPTNSQNFLQSKRRHVVFQDIHFRAMYRYYDKVLKNKKSRRGDAAEEQEPEEEEGAVGGKEETT